MFRIRSYQNFKTSKIIEMKVIYLITPSLNSDINDIVMQIRKDISCGTYSDDLLAVEKTIGNHNWQNYLPSIQLTQIDGTMLYWLILTIHKDQFNLKEEGINHFLGTIAGNIITNSKIQDIIVDDIEFEDTDFNCETDSPDFFFPGPYFGIESLKKEFSKTLTTPRPLLAFSIKPRIGLNPDEYYKVIKQAALSNIDIIEDDERLVSPSYCTFSNRVIQINRVINEIKPNTKFSINITFSPFDIDERFEEAYKAGIRMFKLDVIVAGFDTLLHLRKLINKKINKGGEPCIITVFPDVYGSKYRCISRKLLLKLSRLCGADIIYAGNPFPSRMGSLSLFENFEQDIVNWESKKVGWINKLIDIHSVLINTLKICTKNINTSLPTITHDVDPNWVEIITYLLKIEIGNSMNFAFFVGGGISQSGYNMDIKASCNIWLNVLKYAGDYDLGNLQSIDINKLQFYRDYDLNYQKYLDNMNIKMIATHQTITYNKLSDGTNKF